jgi:asparaginyl-tRNA synthetase
LRYALEHCADDLKILEDRLIEEDKNQAARPTRPHVPDDKLRFVVENQFQRLTYTDAIEILKNSNPNKKVNSSMPSKAGDPTCKASTSGTWWKSTSRNRSSSPTTRRPSRHSTCVLDEPREGVPGPTVSAMDILFPGIGEIVGGSQREERLDVLEARMKEMGVPAEELWWYLDTRRFGTVPHAGFGMGLERFVLFVTGMGNIRDVIPFPRTPKSAEF